MSERSTRTVLFRRCGTWLAATFVVAASLAAQQTQTPAPPDSTRAATAARPTPNADNESDDEPRGPVNRKTATYALPAGEVRIAFGLPKTGGREYEEVDALAAGKVVRFYDAAAIKLSTPVDLLFGDVRIRAGNVAPSYPGVYSLWLQRTASGWQLLFNERADAWGTQHDPAADVAVVPLQYTEVDGLTSVFETRIQVSANNDGTVLLDLHWGKHRWTAVFRTAP